MTELKNDWNIGQKWRNHRKLIAPTFHLNVLKSFIDLFNANARAVVEKMRKEGNKEFDCHDYMSELTVEILLETAMGVSKSTQSSGFEYAMAVMKYVFIFSAPLTQTFSSIGESSPIFQRCMFGTVGMVVTGVA